MSQPLPAMPSAQDCRCHCGSLLARLVGGGVELKCRRCKRTVWIPLRDEPAPTARRATGGLASAAADE